ncbi:MAG: hypothetical protein ACJ780_17115 [Solirubrobacteraceae bacterium]
MAHELLWAVNLGSIELHSSLHTRQDLHRPTVLAFDLDPGPGASILPCGDVALRLRHLFDTPELATYPKTPASPASPARWRGRRRVRSRLSPPGSEASRSWLPGWR